MIRISQVGLCGSDVHFWRHGRLGGFRVDRPMVVGHEACGVVERLADDFNGGKLQTVVSLKVGDSVAIEPGVACTRCSSCLGGRYNLCEAVAFCATPPTDGNLSRYFSHPAHLCYKLPANVTRRQGALVEPLACAVHACRRAQLSAGQRLLVCGAGPVGLLCASVAGATGVAAICLTDVDQNRLGFARRFLGQQSELGQQSANASCSVHTVLVSSSRSEEELIGAVQQALNGRPNAALECAGAMSSKRLAMLSVERGSRVVLVGRASSDEASSPAGLLLDEASRREVDLIGCMRYDAGCFSTAIQLISDGRFDVGPLVTHVFPLSASAEAFRVASDRSTGAIKVVVEC